jgi:hypothetical protein
MSWKRKGGNRVRKKRQAKLKATVIGDAPNAQKTSSDKKSRKLSCFKCKKLGTWQGIAQSSSWDPVMNAPKEEVYQRQWRCLPERGLASQNSGCIG